MVALDLVHASNARLRELGPGLVALFGQYIHTHYFWTGACTNVA